MLFGRSVKTPDEVQNLTAQIEELKRQLQVRTGQTFRLTAKAAKYQKEMLVAMQDQEFEASTANKHQKRADQFRNELQVLHEELDASVEDKEKMAHELDQLQASYQLLQTTLEDTQKALDHERTKSAAETNTLKRKLETEEDSANKRVRALESDNKLLKYKVEAEEMLHNATKQQLEDTRKHNEDKLELHKQLEELRRVHSTSTPRPQQRSADS